MKISSICIVFVVIYTSKGYGKPQNVEDGSLISNQPKERLKFPKSSLKFTVNPLQERVTPKHVKEDITTRKPIMARIIPIIKSSDIKNSETITRRPLMKLRTFTVTMRSKTKTNKETKSHLKSKESSEETIQPPEFTEMGKLSVEEQDRKEFIFLDKKHAKNYQKDLLDSSEEDYETTTRLESRRHRRDRSSNIIEEENLGTTISVFKYTGGDNRLTSDLQYKNIHS